MKNLHLLLILSVWLSLAACTQNHVQTDKQAEARVFLSQANVHSEVDSSINGMEDVYKDFPPDTLYALMLAEIALSRDMPDLGLGYYRREAHKTRDPAVIKRALEISSWLEAHQISLELIALWQEVEPDNPVAHMIMARQQLYFGLVEGSLLSIERVLALGEPFNFDYFNQLVPRLPESGQLELLRKLEILNDKYPDNSQLSLSRAHLYALLDQRQSALDAATRARKLDKYDDRPVIMRSELRFNYGHEREALKEMEKGVRQFPDSKPLHLLYIQSLLKLGKNTQAERQISASMQHFPDELEFRYRLALITADFRLYTIASDLFRESVANNYRREESFFYLSRIAEKEQRYDDAVTYLENIHPGVGFIEARLQIAYILNQKGNLDEALESLNQANAQQRDNNGTFFHAQADLLSEAGRKEEALTMYSKGLESYPQVFKLRYAKAMLAESMDKLDIVEQELLYIIEREPNHAMALNALGYTLTNKTQRHQEALKYIERAYEIAPDDAAIIDSLGWVYYQLGDYEQALKYLRRALALQADHEIAAHLGEVLWVSGLEQEAKRVWDEALVKNQNSEILKQVMSRFIDGQSE